MPNVIRVPKPNRKQSYQPHRLLGKNVLLQNQVKHFKELEKDLPAQHQTGIRHEEIRTEAEAAQYIRRMTEKLHQLGGKA